MATKPSSHDGRRFTRLFGYVLAEFPPATRQRLDLSSCSPLSDASNNNLSIISKGRCCSAAVAIDAETTARLRGECSSRGVPLESALLASMYLAAARAVGKEGEVPRAASEGNGVHQGNISRRTNDAVRLQRAVVLGIVSVVMALLSGSVDSKVLRYFCSFYAIFAGAWAVNVLTVEAPGFMFVMATSADIKGGGGARAPAGGRCRPTYKPVRLAVDSRRGLWETAERHKRVALGMTLSEKSFSRFKRRARGARRAWLWCSRQWERRRRASASLALAPQETGVQQGPPPHFQLFGCIEMDGRVDDADLAALLVALDSRYTLVYRTARGSPMASSNGGGSNGGIGGSGAFEQTATTAAVAPASKDEEGLELTFVERPSVRSGRSAKDGNSTYMAKWLMKEATAILVGEVAPPSA
ncbi:unnamed protein product [Ectocarpus sp. 12 AP-2014]